MKLPALQSGVLVRRYKRFLADIETEAGALLTAHCPNTGAMTGCAEPGSPVWYSQSDNPKRKYPHTLEIVQSASGLVSVNTGRANALVAEALAAGVILELAGCTDIKAEAKIPEGDGRFDFRLEMPDGKTAYIEVKSATLYVGDGEGAFPDAVSTRALKHVQALLRRVQAGERGILIFCAQHCGIGSVRAAGEVDADYAAALTSARDQGVEVLAYGCQTDLCEMSIDRKLPFLFD
jgi:sugar fermentation stimulation protein A